MEEKFTRIERNAELYRENEDHNFRVYFYYILLPITIILIMFACINVKATSSLNVTNGTTPGTDCSTHPTGKLCYKFRESYPAGNGELYTIGNEELGVNVYKINFYLNTSVEGYTHNTIKIIGKNFRNIGYLCTSSFFSCRVVYVSSTQLNVHFSNNTSNIRTQTEFALYTDSGAIFNSNDIFKITSLTYLWNPQDTSGGGSSGGGSSGGGSSGSTFDDTGIINNQNQNTEDIINNANQNTQDIIDEIGGLFKSDCYENMFNLNAYSNTNGNLIKEGSINGFKIPANIYNAASGVKLKDFCPSCVAGETYYLSGTTTSFNSRYIYIGEVWNYGTTKTLTDTMLNTNVNFYGNYEMSSATGYVALGNIAIYKGSTDKEWVPYGDESCKNKIDEEIWWQKEISNNQKETNDLIKDDSVNQNQANSFFNDFEDTDNGGISSIISKPLTIINNLLNNNNSCSNLQLPSFMGVDNAYLPSGCILWNNAPSVVITLWNTLVIGLGSYFILKSLFNDIQKLKDPENDKVEVMDL